MKSALGSKYVDDYDKFKNDPEILNLQTLIAYMKTVLIEFRDSIEGRKLSRVYDFANDLVDTMLDELDPYMDEELEFRPKDREKLVDIIIQKFADHLGEVAAGMTAKDMTVVTQAVSTIAQVAEKAKKLKEGITVNVNWNDQLLERLAVFVQKVVMKNVSDPLVRMRIAKDATMFFGHQGQNVMAIAGAHEDVIDVTEG